MRTSDNIDLISAALCEVQGIMSAAKKTKINPHLKSPYATLPDCYDALREPLHKHGLSLLQPASLADGRVVITTRILHKSGQWIESELSLKPSKDDPQAVGSCITYGCRYSLSILGLSTVEDDDGNKSTPLQLFDVDKGKKEVWSRFKPFFVSADGSLSEENKQALSSLCQAVLKELVGLEWQFALRELKKEVASYQENRRALEE